MAARICKSCGVRFPPDNVMNCRICDEKTSWQPYIAHDLDWEAKVTATQEPETPDYALSKETEWRRDQLLKAGYTDTQALFIALAKEIDLHEARTLAKSAGPYMAFRILS